MIETQFAKARKGEVTPEIEEVAREEGMELQALMGWVAEGKVVIPANRAHRGLRPKGIGEGLTVKVNANIGTSSDHADPAEELQKLELAMEAGADTVMDLSTGGDIDYIRRLILERSPLPVGTVPIYQAAIEVAERKGGIVFMTPDDIFDVIERHAKDGVDFITVHCGVTLNALERLKAQRRITDIVSRGGAFLTTWMIYNEQENPLYEHFDRLLEIAKRYDVTLSLGDGLRPGCLADATDRPQIQELLLLGELTERAWEAEVQVMIEGPGHVPLDQIETNVVLEKKLCKGAPFYVLGPLVTDIAPGYDHIVCAIGGALAAYYGADFLCYVTPAEHLKLPSPEDVREGVIATRIAAHAADVARGRKGAMERDEEISRGRKALDWERQISLSIDPEKARRYREQSRPQMDEVCTMCGKFCAIKMVREFFRKGE
ncbi:MAG: phosphomethylpyrimidine synthase ThiC [Deltaproteobacteria bacterium]|nr:phosphomethylpyrimidine synthase ThiC [Deltaproteobacteria bacterium]